MDDVNMRFVPKAKVEEFITYRNEHRNMPRTLLERSYYDLDLCHQ